MTRWARAALLVTVLLASAGCDVDVRLDVDLRDDGSGTVSVGLGFDDEAVEELGGLRGQPRLDDLAPAGWTVADPREEDDGKTWIRMSKPFANPTEAALVIEELSGDDGPLRNVHLEREHSYARTTWRFSATWDFRAGGAALSDPALTKALDGQPLGQSIAEYERRYGAPIDELVKVAVTVRLPGEIASNAPDERATDAAWQLRLRRTAPVELRASGREVDQQAIGWAVAGLVAGSALLLLLVVRLLRAWRRTARR